MNNTSYNIVEEKGWGSELIFANTSEYCGKILNFKKGKKFSMHFHALKNETWYVVKGSLDLVRINTTTSKTETITLKTGDTITIPKLVPHQLFALEDSEIFEVSTTDFKTDSYRVLPGDSQL
jgi:mannose-6-phosphate isomerase-like protein (cupin superfamily)